jgi:hypothetical protein
MTVVPIEPDVGPVKIRARTFDPVVAVSEAAVNVSDVPYRNFTVTDCESATRTSGTVTDTIEDADLSAAATGTTDNRPKPIADTATSAMRLRSVFVDICFLSISQG